MKFRRLFLLRRDTWPELVTDIGRISRFLFFAMAIAGIIALTQMWDWSASTTPLAQLTLARLGTSVAGVVLLLALGWIWIMWAFSSKRQYEKWAWLAAIYAGGILIAAFWVGK